MKPRKIEQIPQDTLFRLELDQRHALYKLASQTDWNAAEERFRNLYSLMHMWSYFPKNI